MQQPILDALRRGAHDDALTLAREAVAAKPDDPQAHQLLAMAQRADGAHGDALDSIERAIALSPEDAHLHFHRAGYLLGRRDIGAARSSLETTIRLDPNQFGAYVLQAQLALGRNDLDDAERIARLAARIDPEHHWLKALQGMVALRRGDPDTALAVIGQAALTAPDDPQVRYALGLAYLAKGHFAFAEQAFRGVLEAVPGARMTHVLIAGALQQQGRMEEAADALQPVLDGATATPALHRYAGELELVAGRPAAAMHHLRTAFDASPLDLRTLDGLCTLWHRGSDVDEACTVLDAALLREPGFEPLWRARLAFEP
ncbi:MAG TPA: tetratricopeptide repeat protein, partial [Luteimonas sp.]|nr:tetratricopeptide repeat protein [Luteimonas sp.]